LQKAKKKSIRPEAATTNSLAKLKATKRAKEKIYNKKKATHTHEKSERESECSPPQKQQQWAAVQWDADKKRDKTLQKTNKRVSTQGLA